MAQEALIKLSQLNDLLPGMCAQCKTVLEDGLTIYHKEDAMLLSTKKALEKIATQAEKLADRLVLGPRLAQRALLREGGHFGRCWVDSLVAIVAEEFGVTVKDLLCPSKARELTVPRHVAMYLLSKMNRMSYSSLGRLFRRDHASVMYAVSRTAELRLKNKALDKQITGLIARIEGEREMGPHERQMQGHS